MAILKANGIDIYFEESGNPAGEPVLLIMGFSMNAGAWGAQIDALKAKLGALTEAGYQEVFASGTNFDVNKTFAFMGDPLTPARIAPVDAIYLPKLNRVD